MMIVATIIVFLYLLGLGVLAVALRRAPEGFEDDKGFHDGKRTLEDEIAL